MKNNLFLFLLVGILSSCSLWERKQFEYTYQQINENEILVDFTKINPGSWDTLLLIPPYTTSDQIKVGYLDSEYLEQRALADWIIVAAYLENGNMTAYSSCSRSPTDLDQVLEDQDSVLTKKFPRSKAVFRFIKGEDGTYKLKK